MKYLFERKSSLGFTLVEAIVVIGILGIVVISVLTMFNNSIKGSAAARTRLVAVSLANQEMEKIRNTDYDKICLEGEGAECHLLSQSEVEKGGIKYEIYIKDGYEDNAFDGCGYVMCSCQGKHVCELTTCEANCTLVSQATVDDTPEDYKKVEVKVTWDKFYRNVPVTLSTIVAPKGLETPSDTGALAIKVFDADGLGVPQAQVSIQSQSLGYSRTNWTDDEGNLQVLGLSPANDYHIQTTKVNYSTDQTYPRHVCSHDQQTPCETSDGCDDGADQDQDEDNGNEEFCLITPINPDKAVVAGQVTEASFSIDQLSELALTTVNPSCNYIGLAALKLEGEKIIGQDELNYNIIKNTQWIETRADTSIVLDLEWDNYTLFVTDQNYDVATGQNYDVAGVIPPIPLNITPGIYRDTQLVLEDHSNNSLLVTVKDSGTENPIADASVTLNGQTKVTNAGSLEQTDWSAGPDQDGLFVNPNAYAWDNGNLDVTSSQITLKTEINSLSFSEDFTTTFYKDEAATTANWDTSAGNVTLKKEVLSYKSNQSVISSLAHEDTKKNTFRISAKANINAIIEPPAIGLNPASLTFTAEQVVFEKKVDSIVYKETKIDNFHMAAIAPPPIPVPPFISLNPTSLSFSAQQGNPPPSSKTFTITNTEGGTLNWSVSEPVDCPWLNEAPTSGNSNSATITVSPNTATLASGIYNCTIRVTSNNADNSPQNVSVTYTINPVALHINLTTTSLSFTAEQNGPIPPSKTFTIFVTVDTGDVDGDGDVDLDDVIFLSNYLIKGGTAPNPSSRGDITGDGKINLTDVLVLTNLVNTGGGTLNWTVSELVACTWLDEGPTTGNSNRATITVWPTTSSLAPGVYNCTIKVTGTNATNSPQQVTVSYKITAPHISLNQTSLSFSAQQGNPLPPPSQPFTITNTGSGTLNWTVKELVECAWLNESPTTGNSNSATITVSPGAPTLAGIYNCTIRVTSTNADNSPQTVAVTYTITAPALVYRTPGYVQTKKINDNNAGKVIKATLTVNQDKPAGTEIVYYLSADGGSHFEIVTPGNEHEFANQGVDLRFRAGLSTNNTNVTPTINSFNISYTLETYVSPGELTSSTFEPGVSSVFGALSWSPSSQPAGTTVKFQIATTDNLGSWNFIGPGGTAGSRYDTSGSDIISVHDDDRYLRYKLFLETTDPASTPSVSNISISYANGCLPPGQVFFKNLTAGPNYNLQVSKTGYAPATTTIENLSGYNRREILLTSMAP